MPIRMMMAMSADGKIASVQREAAHFTSAEDKRRLVEQVAWADYVLMAAGTLRAYGASFQVREPRLLDARQASGQPPQPVSAIITASLDLPLDMRFFAEQRIPRMIVTDELRAEEAERRFGELAEVVACGQDRVDVPALVERLYVRGAERILALGGGSLNFALADAGLLDELFITVAPILFGGKDAPAVMEGAGFDPDDAPALRLASCEQVGDEVFLRYEVAT